jgi:glycosyltransferase involved in cell wall biosynthesis
LLHSAFPELHAQVLYHGSDLAKLRALSTRTRKFEPSGRAIKVLFMGRFESEMGVEYFLELASALAHLSPDRFEFAMCGQRGGMSTQAAEFKAGFSGQMDIYESVSFQERNRLIAAAEFLIVPSINERACFGLAVVEGLAARCFVLARDIGDHSEAALHDAHFLFDRNLPAELLGEQITRLAVELRAGVYHEQLDVISTKVIERFDIDVCLQRQVDVLNAA